MFLFSTLIRERGHSRGFHLAFSTLIAATPQAKDPKWKLLQLPSMLIPIIHSGTGEMTTGWVRGPEITVGWTLSRTPFITWPLSTLLLAVREEHDDPWVFGLSVSTQTLCPIILEMSDYCPSSHVLSAHLFCSRDRVVYWPSCHLLVERAAPWLSTLTFSGHCDCSPPASGV